MYTYVLCIILFSRLLIMQFVMSYTTYFLGEIYNEYSVIFLRD